MPIGCIFYISVGFVAGGIFAWLIVAGRAKKMERRVFGLDGTVAELRTQNKKTEEELERLQSKLESEQGAKVEAETLLSETRHRLVEEKKMLDDAKARLMDAFKAIAGDTLDNSTTAFLRLAKETFDKVLAEARGDFGKRQEAIQGLVNPLSESLRQFEGHVRALEKNRQEAYSGLAEQLKSLSTTQQKLQKETANLVTALRKPHVRGRWGEMTLKRVVELAGMSEHCDFAEQVVSDSEKGKYRPDLIVRLPAGREIVVDAKVPLEAYLDAISADSEELRKAAMSRHVSQVRSHMNALADKRYWTQFTKAPEFAVMFIPGESFFSAAVDADHRLIEDGLERRVVLATPTTLIALLRAVAYGWRQEQVARNAQEISDLGKQLYERMATLAEHIANIGRGLEKASTAYNSAVGSIEARVMPAARRFKELGAVSGPDVPIIQSVEATPRQMTASEFI
ncbi:MAG: DNA recombination protein RmuC [Pseudomonadota bacterium]